MRDIEISCSCGERWRLRKLGLPGLADALADIAPQHRGEGHEVLVELAEETS